jgi:predicted HD superfamily hydrolase involved in NAD metabolism
MNAEEILAKLKSILPEKRFRHTLGVTDTALKLARIYSADKERVFLASLLHDCAKHMTDEEMIEFLNKRNIEADPVMKAIGGNVLHALVARYLAQEEYGIEDPEILSAIECHTLGKVGMTLTEKIVFISDYIEPGRKFEGVEVLQKLAPKNLDEAVVAAIRSTLMYLLSENRLIHPRLLETRNDFLIKKASEEKEM